VELHQKLLLQCVSCGHEGRDRQRHGRRGREGEGHCVGHSGDPRRLYGLLTSADWGGMRGPSGLVVWVGGADLRCSLSKEKGEQ
jgi:hypothetical protein